MPRPAFTEIENGVFTRYWNCPRQFLPYSIVRNTPSWDVHGNRWDGFLGLYRYADKYARVPEYEECSARFLKASAYYEWKLNEYIKNRTDREEKRWQQKYSKLRPGSKIS
jgi:hypothetical protein